MFEKNTSPSRASEGAMMPLQGGKKKRVTAVLNQKEKSESLSRGREKISPQWSLQITKEDGWPAAKKKGGGRGPEHSPEGVGA